MSSVIIDDYDGDIIQSMSDNFRGFHPRAKEVFQKYGRYCTYFSTKEGKYLSDLAMRKAAEEKYHILQEGSRPHHRAHQLPERKRIYYLRTSPCLPEERQLESHPPALPAAAVKSAGPVQTHFKRTA